jgi:ATP-dependent RNA helicase DDX27
LEKNITKILKEERLEMSLRRAEMLYQKAENITEYQEEIHNKPKRRWIESVK